ncbi:putative alpha-ketoglutarate-dependent dioxygenase AlkB-like superfamily [Helianthus annuus]|uniref:Alpha-ketoglutarate-dependent dioxygenase AlkB-like superfamily n=1 Tax=Helianthus annuus TaxID=4232 RepID=A0A251T0Z3_HELAN|nr:RNA demethylase ALKBH10B [Helianthus annuus]KAF5777490.1 putative alpha-ketoglutarate-dependent dioxygenase AlkB-like superfamily [Helianthus annuus]KAJ0492692.1 putative alpha-ketoglutarate-dependent dioxygenase AlkB-like superfamily [Helianthus annuus]KAJ0504895.1 putative alpha-ketoglutarate-dependent dioxygenase AlkB-like superfamily [Helianthus annuus]KAJ0862299.1 putative alpha-ketoglutarate-dependent dioxygenase AlkB-like superfamily [Helianthus annuus]
MYMAMPTGNVVVPDKVQYPGGAAVVPTAGAAGGGIGWYPDERDGFISWLRGEFAAANAIIDSLCHHLKTVGEQGEYDGVIGSIQQRRCNWNPVLHMQQYFSVAEVLNALQQVTWKRQQQQQQQQSYRGGGFYDPVKVVGSGKDYKRGGGVGYRQGQGHRGEFAVKDGHNATAEFKIPPKVAHGSTGNLVGIEVSKSDDKDVKLAKLSDGLGTKPQIDNEGKEVDDNANSKGFTNAHSENDSSSLHTSQQKPDVLAIAKTFVGTEILDGKTVNVVDGMKLYDELFDDSGVRKMVSLVNDLRAAGRRGQFQGNTFTVSKRPMKGHGRELIQFGLPIVDAPFDDEAISGTSKDRKIEPIPSLFQEFIERLISMEILKVKPDSCIIDIYNEGDHCLPHMWPGWFGRPVCVLFLTECDITFGKVISSEHAGDYRGSLKLSLTSGSMLVMEGKSADYAKHALPSIRKQRILVTLTKSQPKRATPAPLVPPAHWTPPPIRSPNPVGPKHYVPVPTPGLLPPPNGVQPIFVPAAVAPPMAFPAAPPIGGGAWAAAPPLRQHAPPGTGVFLPPGSNNGVAKHDDEDAISPKEKEKEKVEDCKGGLDESDGKTVVVETEG